MNAMCSLGTNETSETETETEKDRSDHVDIYVAGWWFGTLILLFHILRIVTPTDFHIFQRGRSTTNQLVFFDIPCLIFGGL
jgi:hypothetical protein